VNFRETDTFTNYISSGEREKRSVPRFPEIRADRDRFDSNPVPRKTSESEGTGLPDFGTFLATFLRFPIHSESYREIYPPATIMRRGIKKSAGGSVAARALAARFIPGDLERRRCARMLSHEFHVPSPPLPRSPSRRLRRTRSSPRVRSRSSVYAIDAFVHRAMSIIVCPSVCLFTE